MTKKRQRPAAQMRAKPAARKSKSKSPAAPKRARVKSSRDKVRSHRKRMRAKGYRLLQMWVPDTRSPEFAAEALRRSLRTNNSPLAAEDRAWAEALKPQTPARTFEDIADIAGSVDGLPPDLSSNYKKYLRATGYGRARSR